MHLTLPGHSPLVLALLLSLISLACAGGVTLPIAQGDPHKPPPVPVPSFAADIAPVLNNTCAFAGCHGVPFPNLELIMLTGEAYDRLVNVPSMEVPTLLRVAPGDPDLSYIIQKLEGTAAVGERMPFGGPAMPPEFIATFRQWIAAGAPNN